MSLSITHLFSQKKRLVVIVVYDLLNLAAI